VQEADAVKICRGCPVLAACRDEALAWNRHTDPGGVRGGLTHHDRDVHRRRITYARTTGTPLPVPPDVLRRIATTLRAARRAAGLRQTDVAAALGVSGATVGGWENGTDTPTPERVRAWAAYLGVPVDLPEPEPARAAG
jgi:DNA-binding XRE family transcriptional regulator